MEEKTAQRTRATAYKAPISAILNGKYVRDEEEFAPNYIEIGNIRISRVNIIGIVVSLNGGEAGQDSLVIDDGNNKISVRGFEQNAIPSWAKIGDIINVIGRVREFDSERYIVPEIIKKTDQKWMLVRKREIEKEKIFSYQKETKKEEENREIAIDDIHTDAPKGVLGEHERIVDYIKNNDKGMGVEMEELIKKSGVKECERIAEEMLKEGELFENMPGKVKILE